MHLDLACNIAYVESTDGLSVLLLGYPILWSCRSRSDHSAIVPEYQLVPLYHVSVARPVYLMLFQHASTHLYSTANMPFFKTPDSYY